MLNSLSKRDNIVNRNLTKSYNGWDRAIEDAKRNIVRNQAAIRTFQERKAAGDPWPEEEAGTAKKAIPA
jgi:hypothetical protein